ncbi:MAG TPA: ParB N-terminal domain-containing protein [Candidatus Dormibacteraeota bacterium]
METIRAREDFDSARFKAFRRAIQAALTRRSKRLLSLDRVLAAAGLEGKSFGGVQEIPLDKVVGSAAADAKAQDFDPGFLPANRRLRDRWTRIYTAMVEGDELPPIDVYRLDGYYYVIDGHHRVSVARSLGRREINARVIEVKTRAPVGSGVDGAALLRAAEYSAFLDCTQLHHTRPEARLECSRLGRYDEILKHILGHRYFLGLEQGREVTVADAAASWYDNVYQPIIKLIRKYRVLELMPGSTEADLYVETTRRWLQLSKEGAPSGPDPALHSLLDDESVSFWRRRRSLELDPEP